MRETIEDNWYEVSDLICVYYQIDHIYFLNYELLRATSTDCVSLFVKPFIAIALKYISTTCLYCFLFFLAGYPTIFGGHISLASLACYMCSPIQIGCCEILHFRWTLYFT